MARVNIGHQADLVHRVTFDALTGRGGTVFTLNLDHLVKLERDSAFRHAYDNAAYVTADGAPVVWMARRQNADIVRVTGADLVRPLCAAAANAGIVDHNSCAMFRTQQGNFPTNPAPCASRKAG